MGTGSAARLLTLTLVLILPCPIGLQRLLGETDLERKCRFLLGAGILILMTLSFWGYARQTEGLAYDQMPSNGRLLVRQILRGEHLSSDSKEAINAFQEQPDPGGRDSLADYKYKFLKPDARQTEQKPEGDEVGVVSRMAANPAANEEYYTNAAQGSFHYYAPIRAQSSCIDCHNTAGRHRRPAAAPEGDLMAVVKVSLRQRLIETGVHVNRALLISFAFLTAILIMTGSYLIIRYVVV